jgi:hypothetical protein
MQNWLVIAGLLVLSALAVGSTARAGEYESGFGFGISVPDVWMVLTRDEMTENAAVFLGEGRSSEFASVPLSMRRVIHNRVLAGELEVFYRRAEVSGFFVDNVNVLMQSAALPSTLEELERICQILPTEFSRVFGRPIAMDVCEMRERVSRRALYLQFDGAILGTTTLQYQLQRDDRSTLILTATAATENLPRMMGEFEEMLASIRLH